ncbi:hypothetical protein Tco_0897614, partial [Tanacetum coccineum]
MSKEQGQQVARDESLVPSADKVKISATNMRIEPSMPQKEETFQVIIEIIKASPCFKAFAITTDVPEIYMQQFWFTIKKTKKTPFYEFSLADKKFSVDVELFRKILAICPRVHNEDFVAPPSEKELITFLIELGYKGPFDHLARMFVDHMHQSENVNYPELIWEDFQYQIDYRQLKFVRIGEDFQEYGLAIPNTMLTDEIKQSETYQTFIKYSTGLIPPKKSRGKGSQGKKLAVTPKPASVEVCDESDPEPAKRQTGNRRSRGIQVMSTEEQLATYMKKAIKASKESLKLPHQTRDLSEGAGITPEVLDEFMVKFTTSIEGANDDDEEDDDMSIKIAETDDKRTKSENDDQEMNDAEKIIGEKLEEEKGNEEEEQADDDQAQEDQDEDDIEPDEEHVHDMSLDAEENIADEMGKANE